MLDSGRSPEVLRATGISKSFPGVQALDDVTFVARSHEVVALIGENGAGKSTLMKILAGLHRPDGGAVELQGQRIELQSPLDALQRGIALIHQELNLCDNLTVAGAMFLGAELRVGPFLRDREMAKRTTQWLSRLGLDIDPQTRVEDLRPGQKQMLEIARALRLDAKVLIMDEPTSSLTQPEVERLFAVVEDLKQQGCAVIYITHRLAEIERLADCVIGLRDGRNSGELVRADIDHDALVQLMVGRELSGQARAAHATGEPALEVRGVRTRTYPEASVDLTVRRGEVVGIAGLLGAGRSELLRALFGVDERMTGSVAVAGESLASGDPRAAVAAGLALLPEDRKGEGLVLSMSILENLSLPTLHRRGLKLDRDYERELATSSIEQLGIVCRDGNQAAGSLSGGNQQKIVLGKWLAANPVVLLLDEPTRGVDVGARAEIYRRLDDLAKAGMAVLFVSSELEEVLLLADRVLVMRDGEIRGEVAGEDKTEKNIMMLATGATVA